MFKGEKALCLLRLVWISIIRHAKQQLEFQIGMNNIFIKRCIRRLVHFYIKNALHVNKMGKYWSIL